MKASIHQGNEGQGNENEQSGNNNASKQNKESAVLSKHHEPPDQSVQTLLKLVHSRSGLKTSVSKHTGCINVVRSTYYITILACVRISFAVSKKTSHQSAIRIN